MKYLLLVLLLLAMSSSSAKADTMPILMLDLYIPMIVTSPSFISTPPDMEGTTNDAN